MTSQLIQIIFKIKQGQTAGGWELIKHMALNFGAGEYFILPNWCDILFIGTQKKIVNNGKYFIEILNPTRRDISYVKTLMDFEDFEFIKEQLKANMRLVSSAPNI